MFALLPPRPQVKYPVAYQPTIPLAPIPPNATTYPKVPRTSYQWLPTPRTPEQTQHARTVYEAWAAVLGQGKDVTREAAMVGVPSSPSVDLRNCLEGYLFPMRCYLSRLKETVGFSIAGGTAPQPPPPVVKTAPKPKTATAKTPVTAAPIAAAAAAAATPATPAPTDIVDIAELSANFSTTFPVNYPVEYCQLIALWEAMRDIDWSGVSVVFPDPPKKSAQQAQPKPKPKTLDDEYDDRMKERQMMRKREEEEKEREEREKAPKPAHADVIAMCALPEQYPRPFKPEEILFPNWYPVQPAKPNPSRIRNAEFWYRAYHTVLDAAILVGDVGRVLDTAAEMTASHIHPNSDTYSLLINGLIAMSEHDLAQHFFLMQKEREVEPKEEYEALLWLETEEENNKLVASDDV